MSAAIICAGTSIVFTNVLVAGQARDLRLIEQLAILGRQSGGLHAVTLVADEDVRRTRLTDPTRKWPKLTNWTIGQRLPNQHAQPDADFYDLVGVTYQVIDTTEHSALQTGLAELVPSLRRGDIVVLDHLPAHKITAVRPWAANPSFCSLTRPI